LNFKLGKNHVNKELLEIYNYSNGLNVQYDVKPDIDKKFNSKMALFTRYATASIRYMFNSEDLAMFEFNILQAALVTSNGKSSTTHFDGYYIMFNIPTNQHFHIKYKNQRTNRKDQKFYRIDDPEHKIFLTAEDYDPENKNVIRPLDHEFVLMYEKAKQIFKTDKVSIGSDKHQIHVAVSKKIRQKSFKIIDEASLRDYYYEFTKIIGETIEMAQYIDGQDLSY
jgi:hypothetical protein